MNQEERALAASRPLGVANELGATEPDPETVYTKRVVLTGELATLSTRNGQWCFLDCLRLLPRVVGVLDVAVLDGLPDFAAEVDEIIKSVWSQGNVRRIQMRELAFDGATAILNIGLEVRPELPWTSIQSNGWVARCTSGSRPLETDTDQDNPVSCLLAASFGVGEVFKRVYGLSPDKAPLMEDAAFSLFEFSTSPAGHGPCLPASISLPDTLVLGAGAIGNGLVLLLSQLPLIGRVLVMDKQNFGVENFGTCTLLDSSDWLGSSKAKMLAGWLKEQSHLEVEGMTTTIENALSGTAFSNKIDLVINGLDDIDARRAVQKLWPSLLVDGAINSAGAAVVTHSIHNKKFACLRCTFPALDENHIDQQAKATGLNPNSLAGDQHRQITDEDIDLAEESSREWLRGQQRLGRTICSTISTGIAENLGLKLAKGFRPSVPFVATASAALVIAQVLRNLSWPHEPFIHEFQFSSLFVGTATAVKVGRLADPGCECTKNATVIDALVARRRASSDQHGGG